MSDVAELMKRCQRGVGGRNALDEAHDIMAECYGTLGRLEAERAALEAERDALRAEISDLHTTMMAAAVEIQEHWAAHCDEEGYGPANLMHRLERGIASQYGYTARTLVMVEAERDALRQQLAERDKLAELLREARRKMAYMLKHGDWYSPEELIERIDAELSELTP